MQTNCLPLYHNKSEDIEVLISVELTPRQLDLQTIHLEKLHTRQSSEVCIAEGLSSSCNRKRAADQDYSCINDPTDRRVLVPKRRRNALVPNGIEAEILKDVCLLFQMESVSFTPASFLDATSQKSSTDCADDSDESLIITSSPLDSESDSDCGSQISTV